MEKLRLLSDGQLNRAVDIFDLFFHGAPLLFVFGKLLLDRSAPSSDGTRE